jgi:hypothetical protein
MTQMTQYTSIIFKNSVAIHDAIVYDLPNNLFWIKTNSGCFVTGIYFDVKYKNELRDKIHDILWFFGEFDD